MAEEVQEKKEPAIINFVCPICQSPMKPKSTTGFGNVSSEKMVCSKPDCASHQPARGW